MVGLLLCLPRVSRCLRWRWSVESKAVHEVNKPRKDEPAACMVANISLTTLPSIEADSESDQSRGGRDGEGEGNMSPEDEGREGDEAWGDEMGEGEEGEGEEEGPMPDPPPVALKESIEVYREAPRRWYTGTVAEIVEDVGRRWAVLVAYDESLDEIYHCLDGGEDSVKWRWRRKKQ
eukprot:scaffold1248_cov122-Isochrysis_galbana.AAC.4